MWALVGRFVPMFLYLGTTMFLARYLTPDDFGMVGVLAIFFNVAKTLMDAGLGGSLVKEKKLTKLDCSTIFVFNIVVSIILYSILFCLAGSIESYFETPGLSTVVKVLCSVFIIDSFGLVPLSILTRELNFYAITVVNVVSVVLAAIVSVIFAINGLGVFALVAYQIVSAIVIVLLSMKYSGFIVSFRFSGNSFHRLISFGVFTTLTTLIDSIYENLITFLFGKHLSMQHAGYLSQAKRLEEVPSLSVAQTISNVAFPVLTHLREDGKKFADECGSTIQSILLLLLPLLFSVSVFSEPIIYIVFGVQWLPAASYLSLLIFAAVFHVAETLNRTFIKATTMVQKLFVYTLVKRIIGIVLIFLFLFIEPRYVLYGYIASTFIGYMLNVFLLSIVSELTIFKQLTSFVQYLLPSVIYFLLMTVFKSVFDSLFINISIAILLLLFYYLVILRLYHLNIIIYLSKFINRRRHK